MLITAEVYVYGYYRTDPSRLQWGFLNRETGIAVIYDMEADLVATVFKPEEGVQPLIGIGPRKTRHGLTFSRNSNPRWGLGYVGREGALFRLDMLREIGSGWIFHGR